jgi:hypothetical protein
MESGPAGIAGGGRDVPIKDCEEYVEKTSLSGCVLVGFKNTPAIAALSLVNA